MKTKRFLALLLSVMMVLGMMPMTVFAYFEEPSAEGNNALETTVYDYTKPIGVTMQRLTGNCVAEFGEDGNLGDDLLFVIKSGDRYYAMKDVPASETAYNSIPAVEVTDWVNADGTLTVPADTLGVAFWRYEQRPEYEYGMFINGREDYLAYSYGYESVDGDDDYYNDAERTYWGKFKISTYEDGEYIESDPFYWSENGTSGTLQFSGRWPYYINNYNSVYLKYNIIADLITDGNGGWKFCFRYLGTDVEYVGDEVEGYLYYADCRHQGTIRHAEYDAPTCMLKGCEEYWYCENCNRYAKDKNFTEFFGEEMPVIPATGHDFDGEACKNCNRPVPVYSKVTNQAQFDALADDTMFILVAEYNGKHYAMDFSELYSYMIDSDGDGFYDIHDVDDDLDGIPDYLEFDEGGEEGVYDYLEWDMDNDGDVDDYDLHEFHLMICDQHLTDMLYRNGSINATEITVNSDGTFSHEEAKKTAEFEMVDVYLAEDYDPDWHSYWENGVMPYHTKCIKQFAVPNYFLSAPSMRPIERMYQQRIYDFGDSSHWGVIFYDSRDEYYSYVDSDMDAKVDADEDGKPDPLPFPDISKEGSVAVFDTFDDIMWILYDEGQMAQLRLRDYNGTIGFVTGHDYELEGTEWVYDESTGKEYYDTHDTQACVYLYASAQYDSHTCDFGDWVDDENGRTHTRTCNDPECGKIETEDHGWDNGVETKAPTCTEAGVKTFTCSECKATKTDDIPALDHDWSDWKHLDDYSHVRDCKRNCGITQEIEGHEWGDPTPVDNDTHKAICDICKGERTDVHDWDDGVVTKEPTEWEEGVKTYTCVDCSHTKTEPVDKLVHECTWTDWYPNGDENHKRDCMDENCDKFETLPHEWDNGVITKEPTCKETGLKTFTCLTCQHTRTEVVPTTDHVFGDWTPNNDGKTHSRYCNCNESETAEHKFDDGEVTQAPTHEAVGEIKYTCTDCKYFYTEDIPALTDHEWSNWTPDGEDKHTRSCKCNAIETDKHHFDNGVITKQATHTSKGVKTYTCTDCKYSYTEDIPKTATHLWMNWSGNKNGTHTRTCRCKAIETKACTYDNGVVTKQPTHDEEGIKTYTCTVCKATKTEPIPKMTSHEWSEWAKKDDKSHIRECKCGETEIKGHTFDVGIVTKEPTHFETGVKKFTCTDCGFVLEDTLDKIIEHSFGEWKPSEEAQGKHYRECACGASETGDCAWDAGVVTTEPTYEATGVKTYTCTICDGTKTETLDMLVKAEEIVSPDNREVKITTPEGSNAVLNENTVLKVEEVKDEVSDDVKANIEIVVGNDNAEVLASYDISLLLEGVTVQPGGAVEVTLPAPENAADFDTLQVIYIDDDGNVTPCETRVNADGTVTFVTDHFSHYAIIGVQNISPIVWILISAISVALISGAVVAVLVIKKKKGIA